MKLLRMSAGSTLIYIVKLFVTFHFPRVTLGY